jgi:hypothetical protein
MSILKTGRNATLARAGVSVALAAAAVGGLATASHAAGVTQTALTLSATTGPVGGTNTITLSLPSTATSKFVSGAVGVQFQNTTSTAAATATCATNPSTGAATAQVTAAASAVRFLSTTKVSVQVPDLSTGTTSYWLVCAYNAANATPIPPTATVLGRANYVVAAAPTIASISPTSGPAYGGQTITVTGTNFPTSITATTPLSATLGGSPMTSITPISATQFTAVTPAHAASATAVAMTVTTNGGTYTTGVGGNIANPYTYKNGITVSPNTAVGGTSVDIDVTGVGFSALTFVTTDGTAPDDANPHVYLAQGVYDVTNYAAGTTNKTLPEKTECTNVAVISDTELICTVDTTHRINNGGAGTYTYAAAQLADGTYTVTVVDKGNAAPTYQSVLSSGATFTVANF